MLVEKAAVALAWSAPVDAQPATQRRRAPTLVLVACSPAIHKIDCVEVAPPTFDDDFGPRSV